MKSAKFALILAMASILLAACSSQEPTASSSAGTPTEPPFRNEEPEKYQTYIVQTTPAETVRFFVARDGERWRVDSAHGTPVQTATLHTDKDYILAVGAKAYSDYPSPPHGFDERPNMLQEITYGMINGRDDAVYEKVEEAGGVVKYKYVDPKGKEAVITFDEAKGLPVRKEIFNIKDGTRTQEVVISLEEFTTEVDGSNFEVPKDFKRVTPKEMKEILSANFRSL